MTGNSQDVLFPQLFLLSKYLKQGLNKNITIIHIFPLTPTKEKKMEKEKTNVTGDKIDYECPLRNLNLNLHHSVRGK